MEINTKILDIKNRVGKKSNKIYWSIETAAGNFNCHEQRVVDEVKPYINGMCNLAIRETPKADGNGVWKNIIGVVTDSVNEPVNKYEPKGSENQFKEQLIKKFNGDDKPSFYVSYAKDLMCYAGKTRDEAIADIKEIREAFN